MTSRTCWKWRPKSIGNAKRWIMKDASCTWNTTMPGYKRNARQQCSTLFTSSDTTMPRLNADSRQRALGNLEAGMVAKQVARAFGVHVYRLTDRFLQNNNVVDRPRSGRHRVTSQRQDRNIVRTHMRDRVPTSYHNSPADSGNPQPARFPHHGTTSSDRRPSELSSTVHWTTSHTATSHCTTQLGCSASTVAEPTVAEHRLLRRKPLLRR